MTSPSTPAITNEQRLQFRKQGYIILQRAIDEHTLELLREECGRYVRELDEAMDREGVAVSGLNRKNSRYFIFNKWKDNHSLRGFLFGSLMADLCRATIGDEAYLFWEQFVVKFAEVGTRFAWHQDSSYVRFPHAPYLTCWCALDDMTEHNGTIYVLPSSVVNVTQPLPHWHDPDTNDLVGYAGDEPGVPIVVPAGSVVVFSSLTLHRSGWNRSEKARRAYVVQYSPQPIMDANGKLPGFAEPLLTNGELQSSVTPGLIGQTFSDRRSDPK